MSWKSFDKRNIQATKNPMVTIQRNGPFSLNKAAHQLLGEPEAVELLFDDETHKVGFRPIDQKNPRAFMVRPQGKNNATFMVAGQSFSKHFGIDTSQARRYSVDMEEDVLVLDLNSDYVIATSPRSKSAGNG